MKVIEIINLVTKLVDEIEAKKCVEYCLKNNMDIETFLNLKNQTAVEGDEGYIEVPSFLNTQTEKELRLILDSINIAQMLVATEYKPLFITENLIVINNEFIIDNLSQKLFKVKEITKNNIKQNYKLIDNKIQISNGEYLVTYSYIPTEVNFEDTIVNFNNISLVTFAYLVCSQFCLIKCSYEESAMWQEKFEQALMRNFKPIKNIKIKSRRWL